jgi:hypothetical protein
MLHKPDPKTEKVLKLADFIDELEPERFSMRQWGVHSEPRCICGWLMHNEGIIEKDNWQEAALILGMDENIAQRMFQQPLRSDIDNHKAAKALRHYAVTGEFNGW